MQQLPSGALVLLSDHTDPGDPDVAVVLSDGSVEVHRGGEVLLRVTLPRGLAPYAASISRVDGRLRIEIPREAC